MKIKKLIAIIINSILFFIMGYLIAYYIFGSKFVNLNNVDGIFVRFFTILISLSFVTLGNYLYNEINKHD